MNKNRIDIEDIAAQLDCHTKAFSIIADGLSREIISIQTSEGCAYMESLLYSCDALASVRYGLDSIQDQLQAAIERTLCSRGENEESP